MPETISNVSAVLLALTFAWASLAKLVRWRRWRAALDRYRLSRSLDRIARVGVPAGEAAVVALVVAGRVRIAAALVVALLSAFSLAVLRARETEGKKLPCGCFGRAEARDYRAMLLRNALLGTLAAAVLLVPRGAADGWDVPARGELLPAFLTATGIALLAWVAWQVSSALRGRA